MTGVQTIGAAPKANMLGRALRACAGVDESVLDRCHWERSRYTGLGGAVLGTASVAALSMGVGLATTTKHLGPAIVLVALGWGIFIFNFDRWMVSSTHGLGGKSALIPRIGFALVFGIIIAEPVVLTIFAGAIETHIKDSRQEQVTAFEALLTRCNPTDPARVATVTSQPDCRDARVNIAPPDARSAQLADLATRRDLASQRLASVQAQLAGTVDRLQREAAGDRGKDTSGRRGVGPIAEGLQRDIKQLTREQADAQNRFDALAKQYQTLAGTTEDSTTSYGARVSAAITKKVDDKRKNLLARKPGLLERIDALHELISAHPNLFVARWFLTGFFAAVECLPVLVKLLSRTTSYDRLVQARLSSAERMDRHGVRLEEETVTEQRDLVRLQQQQDAAVRRDEIRVDTRLRLLDLDQLAAEADRRSPRASTRLQRPPRLPNVTIDDAPPAFLVSDDHPERRRGRSTEPRKRSDGRSRVISIPDQVPRPSAPPDASVVEGQNDMGYVNGSVATALLGQIRTFRNEGGWEKFDH